MSEAVKKTRRQSQLLEQLHHHRFITLKEIASRFSVTNQTARRDLIDLEEKGQVTRRHGGTTLAALPAEPAIEPVTYRMRRFENAAAKLGSGCAWPNWLAMVSPFFWIPAPPARRSRLS